MLLATNRVGIAAVKLDGLVLYHHQMSLELARLGLQVALEIEDLFFFLFNIVSLYVLLEAEFLQLVRVSLLFW